MKARLAAMLLFGLTVAAASQPPARADAQGAPLAVELARVSEAWISSDDQAAAARLDALLGDNRLRGELPRWVAFMRAWLALEAGDRALALEVLAGAAAGADDPRGYVRAARLLVLFDAHPQALLLVRKGRAQAPYSAALRRLEADLLYLGAEHSAALEAFTLMVAEHENPRYPYVVPHMGRWQDARNFKDSPDVAPARQPEPHASLVAPMHWFNTDLPGLDRCIAEMASDSGVAARAEQELPALLEAARKARSAVAALRTGDDEQRRGLERAARHAEFKAACAARIACHALLASAKSEQAAALARGALEVAPEDVALLDLYAIALARQGRAEEARQGPLAQLRVLAGLHATPWMSLDPGVQSQMPERVFAGALALYRVNPQAGRRQFDELVSAFGAPDRALPVRAAALGVWLCQRNEPELARRYLQEASRMEGVLSGRPVRPEAQAAELALLALGEGEAAPENPEQPAQPGNNDEDPAVDLGSVDGKLHPLLRATTRAGGLAAAQMDTRAMLLALTGTQIWGGGYGPDNLLRAQQTVPGGREAALNALYLLPSRIAGQVPAAELDAALAPDSPRMKLLAENLQSYGEAVSRFASTQDWQTRNLVTQKAAPMLGMLEAHATLLRALLLRDKPADLAAWLERHQRQIDLRRACNATSAQDYVRMNAERREAGVPEVVHSGLLLDAAVLLARAGRHAQAAALIWHNRDIAMGLHTREALAALGAAFAAKAGNDVLHARLLLASDPQSRGGQDGPAAHPLMRLLEAPVIVPLLREFGGAAAVARETQALSAYAGDSRTVAAIRELDPDGGARIWAPHTAPTRLATELFQASLQGGQCMHIREHWPIVLSMGAPRVARRLAAWTIVSDFAISSQMQRLTGLTDSTDVMVGWAMLLQLYEADTDGKAAAVRLRRLLLRCASPSEELASVHPSLFE